MCLPVLYIGHAGISACTIRASTYKNKSTFRDGQVDMTKDHSSDRQDNHGLRSDEEIRRFLHGRPTELIFHLREQLARGFPHLREKINPTKGGAYLAYGNKGTDALYLYVSKKWIRIVIDLPTSRSDDLKRIGFEVLEPNKGWQGIAGWITGWKVPYDTKNVDTVVAWAREALQRVK
jgi:hypothetical protein